MGITFDDITAGERLSGVTADADVTVVAAQPNGDTSLTLVYRTDSGELGERILTTDDLVGIAVAHTRRWSFDADGAHLRLASEARRMKWAHLTDPIAAVDAATPPATPNVPTTLTGSDPPDHSSSPSKHPTERYRGWS